MSIMVPLAGPDAVGSPTETLLSIVGLVLLPFLSQQRTGRR